MMQSCCFMRLHTFGVIIGWLGIVGSFIAVILSSIALAKADDIAQIFIEKMKESNTQIDEASLTNLIIIIGSIYLGFALIGLLSSALLVIGTVKERHLLLLPWLINSIIGFIFSCIYHLSIFGSLIANVGTNSEIIPVIIITIVSLVLQFYIIYAVYSLYNKIQANRENTPLVHSTASTGYPNYTKI